MVWRGKCPFLQAYTFEHSIVSSWRCVLGGGRVGIFRRWSLARESECSWNGLVLIVSLVSCPVSASLSTNKPPASAATGQTSPAAMALAPW